MSNTQLAPYRINEAPLAINIKELESLTLKAATDNAAQDLLDKALRISEVIKNIPELCREQAIKGYRNAAICVLEYSAFKKGFWSWFLPLASKLEAQEKMLFDFCQQNNLRPYILKSARGEYSYTIRMCVRW